MDTQKILDYLKKNKCTFQNLSVEREPGIYALFARKSTKLGNFYLSSGEIIYIGLSKDLARRALQNDFSSSGTSSSSVHRSIGAILKQIFKLKAIPRGKGNLKKDFQNYRFLPKGEDRLTNWMKDSLEVAVFPYYGNLNNLKAKLIGLAHPVLCLTKWDNPYKTTVKELISECIKEAQEYFEMHRNKP